MDSALLDRARGCAVGAAAGDALGMPLEFKPARPLARIERTMIAGRLPAGAFTDDTEMALALAESLLAHCPLDPADLAQRFAGWYCDNPPDVGAQVHKVMVRVCAGIPWEEAVEAAQAVWPDAAGNGSVMRCWPVALAHHDDLPGLLADSRLQSRVTHPHADCVAGSAFLGAAIYELLRGTGPAEAVHRALQLAEVPPALAAVIEAAPTRQRSALPNTGWVRHTLESAVWGLLTTSSFEEAVVQVANLGDDADSAAAVAGMLAGAAYGLAAIPAEWTRLLHGRWPIRGDVIWRAADLAALADRLLAL